MTTSEEHEGPTPNGGVKSVAYYQDAEGKPCDRAVATNMLIVEYDKDGNAIQRTYGTCKPKGGDDADD